MNAIHQLKVDKADRRDKVAADKRLAAAGGGSRAPPDFSGVAVGSSSRRGRR